MRGHLISFLLLVVVCCAWRSAAQEGGNTTCRPTTLTSSAFCFDYVTFPVLSTWNDTLEDELAYSDASPGSNLCPYYVSKTYQCEKHFPRCYYVGNSTVNSTALMRLCQSMCYLGKQWNSGECSNYGDLYFQSECLDPQYYAANQPCIYVGLDNSAKWTWQIVLVSVLCAVAGVLIVSFLYSRFKQWKLSKKIQIEDEHEAQMEAVREERRNSLNFKFQPNPVLPGSTSGGGGGGGGGEGTFVQLPPP